MFRAVNDSIRNLDNFVVNDIRLLESGFFKINGFLFKDSVPHYITQVHPAMRDFVKTLAVFNIDTYNHEDIYETIPIDLLATCSNHYWSHMVNLERTLPPPYGQLELDHGQPLNIGMVERMIMRHGRLSRELSGGGYFFVVDFMDSRIYDHTRLLGGRDRSGASAGG